MLGTQGDFPDAGKSPKARQGLPPLDPAIAKFPPSLVLRCACTRAAFCHNKRPIYHFKLSGQIGLLFLPKPYRGHTSCCQSVARQGRPLEHLMVCPITTNPAKVEGAVWKGGAASSGEVRCRAPLIERKSVFSWPAFFFYQKESRTLTFGKVYCTLKR